MKKSILFNYQFMNGMMFNENLKKIFLFVSLIFFFLLPAISQDRSISGRVTDNNNQPISGASVIVKGTNIGTTTNTDGRYILNVPSKAKTLVISSISSLPKDVAITGSTINVVLEQGNAKNLEEVVVTALNINRSKRSLGYATQSIKNEDIIDKGDGSLLNALQGKLAGADITGASGSAGASTTILLRGISSFSGSQQPLFVVDGVPISNDVDESTIGLYEFQSSSRAMDLNVNNIESINILQGPASAALYGSRGAHGAIMITTKKGSGKKNVLDVSFNSSYTSQTVYGFPKLQNKYGQGANGVFSGITTNSLGPAFGSVPSLANGLIVAPAPAAAQYVNGVLYTNGQTIPYQPFPNNIMSYFNTGSVWENNLNINSGDTKTNYGLNIGNSRQVGILPNSKFDKTNIQFSASSNLTDKLSAKANTTYFSTVQDGISQGTNSSYSSYANAIRVPRNVDLEYYKNHITTPTGYNNWFIPNVFNPALQDSSSGGDNPFYAAYKNPIHDVLSRFLGSLTVSYDITKWLNASYRVGEDVYTDRRKRTIAIGSNQVVRSAFTSAPGATTGGIMEDIFYRNELNGDFLLTAKKSNIFLNGLNGSLLLGQGFNQRKFQDLNQTGYGLAVANYYNITNASNLSLTNEFNSLRRITSFYSDLSLAYNNYLFLDFTGRLEKASTLPLKKNSYFYPSVSGSFVVTDALKIESNLLSYAKVRAAYAKVGNDAPVYSLSSTYLSAADGNNVANFQFPFGSIPGFAANPILGNGGLTPEFTSTVEFGANVGLFKNRINIDATIYNSKSTNQIVSVALPSSTGYQSQIRNIGELTNKGIEITLNANPVKTKNFSWSISANYSRNRNKVTKIAPGVTEFAFGGTSFSGLVPTVSVGEPFGIIKGSKFVTNANGDRLIDSTTGQYLNFVSDVTVVDPNRDWIGGLTNTFTYKHLSFSFLLDYKQGGQFESFTIGVLRANGSLKVTDDRETPHILPGVIDLGGGKYRPNNIQINGQSYYNAALGSTTGATTSNEFSVFDATTFRVREVSLSYDLTGTAAHTKIFKNLRFTVFGRNLFYYAPNSLIDPELSTSGAGTGSGLVRGLELVSAPNTRNIGASIRVTF